MMQRNASTPCLGRRSFAHGVRILMLPLVATACRTDTARLQQQIDGEAPGAEVVIPAGTYHERLWLKDGVSLVAAKGAEVIIEADANEGPVIEIDDCPKGVRLQGLRVRHRSKLSRPPSDKRIGMVTVHDSVIELSSVVLENAGDIGLVIDGHSRATLRQCTARGSGRTGIHFGGDGPVVVEDCTIEGNGMSGLSIERTCDALISGNRCARNGGSGILIADAGGIVHDNVLAANARDGMSIRGAATVVTVAGNLAAGNHDSGIAVHEGASARIVNNLCVDTGGYGISINSDGDVTVRGNLVDKGRVVALYFAPNARAFVEGNTLRGGDLHDETFVLQLLARRDYDGLEALVDTMRRDHPRFLTGGWELYWYYVWLGEAEGQGIGGMKPPYREVLDDWAARKPLSPTPHLALAQMYRTLAWQARGEGMADTVSAGAWTTYQDDLAKAHDELLEASKRPPADPMAAEIGLWTAMGSQDDTVLASIVEEGRKADPTFYPMYETRVVSLLPRWGGSQAKVTAFIDVTAGRAAPEDADWTYALLVAKVLMFEGHDKIGPYGVSPARVRKGFEDLVQRFPKSISYKNTAAFALLNVEEWTAANAMFDAIGDQYDSFIWPEKRGYDSDRAMARRKAAARRSE